MTQRLVVIGAGGFGREVLDVIEAINLDARSTGAPSFELAAVLDDGEPDLATLKPYGIDHVLPVSALESLPRDVGYVVGIGSPQVRAELDRRFDHRPCPPVVHPLATIGRAVEIGAGSVICAGVRLTNNIRLGRHVHLNLNATVGHDVRLGNYVTVSPLAAISGYARIMDSVLIGSGSSINPGIIVHQGATVGAGAAVIRDVLDGTTVVGVPAKPR